MEKNRETTTISSGFRIYGLRFRVYGLGAGGLGGLRA